MKRLLKLLMYSVVCCGGMISVTKRIAKRQMKLMLQFLLFFLIELIVNDRDDVDDNQHGCNDENNDG